MNLMNRGKTTNAEFESEKDLVHQLLEEEKQNIKDGFDEGKKQTENLYGQAKESVDDLYEEGKEKVGHAQDTLKEYSNKLVKLVKDKPFFSLFIASGVGFLLSALLKK